MVFIDRDRFIFSLFIFIEYYKRLGVQHFYIYEHSVNQETKDYLNALISDNIATVIPWKSLPNIKTFSGELQGTAEIVNYNGQILAMNDCVLNAYLRYVVFRFDIRLSTYIITNKKGGINRHAVYSFKICVRHDFSHR